MRFITGYVDHYLKLSHQLYKSLNKVYKCNYFVLLNEKTDFIEGYRGAYDYISTLTPARWLLIKDYLLRISDTVQPRDPLSEKGFSTEGTQDLTFVVPPESGLVPKVGDYIEVLHNDTAGYIVQYVEISTTYKIPFFRCTARAVSHRPDVTAIESVYIFDDVTGFIFQEQHYNLLDRIRKNGKEIRNIFLDMLQNTPFLTKDNIADIELTYWISRITEICPIINEQPISAVHISDFVKDFLDNSLYHGLFNYLYQYNNNNVISTVKFITHPVYSKIYNDKKFMLISNNVANPIQKVHEIYDNIDENALLNLARKDDILIEDNKPYTVLFKLIVDFIKQKSLPTLARLNDLHVYLKTTANPLLLAIYLKFLSELCAYIVKNLQYQIDTSIDALDKLDASASIITITPTFLEKMINIPFSVTVSIQNPARKTFDYKISVFNNSNELVSERTISVSGRTTKYEQFDFNGIPIEGTYQYRFVITSGALNLLQQNVVVIVKSPPLILTVEKTFFRIFEGGTVTINFSVTNPGKKVENTRCRVEAIDKANGQVLQTVNFENIRLNETKTGTFDLQINVSTVMTVQLTPEINSNEIQKIDVTVIAIDYFIEFNYQIDKELLYSQQKLDINITARNVTTELNQNAQFKLKTILKRKEVLPSLQLTKTEYTLPSPATISIPVGVINLSNETFQCALVLFDSNFNFIRSVILTITSISMLYNFNLTIPPNTPINTVQTYYIGLIKDSYIFDIEKITVSIKAPQINISADSDSYTFTTADEDAIINTMIDIQTNYDKPTTIIVKTEK